MTEIHRPDIAALKKDVDLLIEDGWGPQVAMILALCDYVEQCERRMEEVEADRLRWRKAFMSVTPSGSEYMDPELCVAFVRYIRKSHHDAQVALVLAKRKLATARDDALEEAAANAERQVIIDAGRGYFGVRPYGREIANEIRSLKSKPKEQD